MDKENSEKHQRLLEEYEKILKEYEEDRKRHDFSMPKEWDEDFRKVMDNTLKRKARHKMLRRFVKAACVVILIVVGFNTYSTQVQGNTLLECFRNSFNQSKLMHEVQGTADQVEILDEVELSDFYYEGDTLDELFLNIRNDRKVPMFYVKDVLEDYEIIEAKYNQEFQLLDITIMTENGYIYITQDFAYNNSSVGIYHDQNEVCTIYNDALEREIPIFDNIEKAGYENYCFSVETERCKFYFDGAATLEQCEKIAKNLYYK